jgi:hypothetical protein
LVCKPSVAEENYDARSEGNLKKHVDSQRKGIDVENRQTDCEDLTAGAGQGSRIQERQAVSCMGPSVTASEQIDSGIDQARIRAEQKAQEHKHESAALQTSVSDEEIMPMRDGLQNVSAHRSNPEIINEETRKFTSGKMQHVQTNTAGAVTLANDEYDNPERADKSRAARVPAEQQHKDELASNARVEGCKGTHSETSLFAQFLALGYQQQSGSPDNLHDKVESGWVDGTAPHQGSSKSTESKRPPRRRSVEPTTQRCCTRERGHSSPEDGLSPVRRSLEHGTQSGIGQVPCQDENAQAKGAMRRLWELPTRGGGEGFEGAESKKKAARERCNGQHTPGESTHEFAQPPPVACRDVDVRAGGLRLYRYETSQPSPSDALPNENCGSARINASSLECASAAACNISTISHTLDSSPSNSMVLTNEGTLCISSLSTSCDVSDCGSPCRVHHEHDKMPRHTHGSSSPESPRVCMRLDCRGVREGGKQALRSNCNSSPENSPGPFCLEQRRVLLRKDSSFSQSATSIPTSLPEDSGGSSVARACAVRAETHVWQRAAHSNGTPVTTAANRSADTGADVRLDSLESTTCLSRDNVAASFAGGSNMRTDSAVRITHGTGMPVKHVHQQAADFNCNGSKNFVHHTDHHGGERESNFNNKIGASFAASVDHDRRSESPSGSVTVQDMHRCGQSCQDDKTTGLAEDAVHDMQHPEDKTSCGHVTRVTYRRATLVPLSLAHRASTTLSESETTTKFQLKQQQQLPQAAAAETATVGSLRATPATSPPEMQSHAAIRIGHKSCTAGRIACPMPPQTADTHTCQPFTSAFSDTAKHSDLTSPESVYPSPVDSKEPSTKQGSTTGNAQNSISSKCMAGDSHKASSCISINSQSTSNLVSKHINQSTHKAASAWTEAAAVVCGIPSTTTISLAQPRSSSVSPAHMATSSPSEVASASPVNPHSLLVTCHHNGSASPESAMSCEEWDRDTVPLQQERCDLFGNGDAQVPKELPVLKPTRVYREVSLV